mmetsp:Transcript_15096/g.37733  ORF Transcript_15096/g.37733 Transcript_15096/m.37733 type:complete len:272 (-) Transcript_15096:2588-3403(-)
MSQRVRVTRTRVLLQKTAQQRQHARSVPLLICWFHELNRLAEDEQCHIRNVGFVQSSEQHDHGGQDVRLARRASHRIGDVKHDCDRVVANPTRCSRGKNLFVLKVCSKCLDETAKMELRTLEFGTPAVVLIDLEDGFGKDFNQLFDLRSEKLHRLLPPIQGVCGDLCDTLITQLHQQISNCICNLNDAFLSHVINILLVHGVGLRQYFVKELRRNHADSECAINLVFPLVGSGPIPSCFCSVNFESSHGRQQLFEIELFCCHEHTCRALDV